MIKETYKQIIFTDNVRKLKKELRKNNNIFIGNINNTNYLGYNELTDILEQNGFTFNNEYMHISMFLDIINSLQNIKYDCVYIYITNIDKIKYTTQSYCYRLNFFNLLNSITNKQIYFIIDIKYKDYVFNQIEEYNKHINRLRSFGEIHNQVIFVDDIEKVKQDVSNKETEMFKEIDGNKCKDIDLFYDQLIKGWKFPDYFVRNFNAFIEFMDDHFPNLWIGSGGNEEFCSMIFHYIENISCVLQSDEEDRCSIFDILYNICNEQIFILIDKKDKEYFLEQVKIWNEKYKYKYE